MTQGRTPAGQQWTDGQQGDYQVGFVSGIKKITLVSEATVADILATGWLDEEKAEIVADIWMAGLDEARDPETDYNAEQILKMKWSEMSSRKASLPWACLWVITQLSLSLSIGGRNFQRVQHMHTGYDSDVNAPTNERRSSRRRKRSSSSDVAA